MKNTQRKVLSVLLIFVIVGSLMFQVNEVYAAAGINTDFRHSTAPGWVFYRSALDEFTGLPTTPSTDTAVLTGDGIIDPVADGWLRLTSNAKYQAGTAIYDTAFANTEGVQVTFQYATYGRTTTEGADGFTFYLIDGSTPTPTVGASGGALGYAWNDANGGNGVTNGYVGIGFDEFGNFSDGSSTVNLYGTNGNGARTPNQIAVRGPGNLHNIGGFPYLTHAALPIETTNRAGAKTVTITITPAPTQHLTVVVDGVTYINDYDLTGYTMPPTFKMGFSASTGNSTNYHEIRDLTIAGLTPTTTTISSSGTSSLGSPVTLTATVTSVSGTPTGSVAFFDGDLYLGTSTLSSGIATFTTSLLSIGLHSINAHYLGDSTFSIAESSVPASRLVVVASTSTPIPTSLPKTASTQAANILPDSGFIPGTITHLAVQSGDKTYKQLGKLWLEIPSLDVQMPIVGVPQTGTEWDVSWLGLNAGWLEGSAFPGWKGNSVLTGHVWNSDNTPGPFRYLDTLVWGDQVIIHSGGMQYKYEVRSVLVVNSWAVSSMMKHKENPWVTLVTCRNYDEDTRSYKYRTLIRAVLIDAIKE